MIRENRIRTDAERRAPDRLVLLTMAVMVAAGVRPVAAAELRFKLINGKPCVKCTLKGETAAIPANVVIDVGTRAPLLLHERTAKLLRVEPDTRMELKFDGLTLGGFRAKAVKLEPLERLTRDYAAELDEIPAVAVLGLAAFADFVIEMEIGEGVLRLLPPSSEDASATTRPPAARPTDPDADDEATGWSGRYEERAYGHWLSATAPDGFALQVLFATSTYDTIIDANVADLAGSAGGAIDDLRIGRLNIARYVAFRPEDLVAGTPAPHADMILGTGFLSHFRVTIHPAKRTVRLEQTRAPRFPAEERAFFVARAKKDAEAIEAFLRDHASSRLARDAAEALLTLRLEQTPPNREAILRAARSFAEAVPNDRRAGFILALTDSLLEKPNPPGGELIGEVVKVGLEYAPAALDARTTHDLRARLGLLALKAGDLKEARRHLLSAAFGIPRDPSVNLWLGQLYEQSDKPLRAWSRYVQAALSDPPPEDALRGLDRLNRDAEFRAGFTMADAEELLEGRIAEFHPADRYAEAAATRPNGGPTTATARGHVRLVELFTCADHPPTQAAQMAFDGLREYFRDTDVVFVAYHIAAPLNDPLIFDASVRRAVFYGVKEAPAAIFDGGEPNTAGGADTDVEKVYAAYKAAATAPESGESPWRLDGRVAARGVEIAGEVTADGPTTKEDVRLHVFLCERLVLAPGANGLILHRQVARAMLSPEGGVPLAGEAGPRTFRVGANVNRISAALERELVALEKAREIRFFMRPTYVDVRACDVVAIVQETQSRRVLAARAFDVAAPSGGAGE